MMDQAQILRKLALERKSKNLAYETKEIDKDKNIPTIITIASGKGGVGKSNIVVNTAISLSKKGKRVMILDADIGMSNIDILLDIKIKDTIISVINGLKKIDDIMVESKYGVSVISGGSAINHIEDFTNTQRERFIDAIGSIRNIDYLIIDTGAGLNKTLLSFISCSNEFILITTPEPTSITDAYSLLKATSNQSVKNRASIVINRASNIQEVKNTFEKIKKVSDKFLSIELSLKGYLIEDKRISQCVKKQVPFVIEYPNNDISKCIYSIADKILNNKYLNELYTEKSMIKKMFNIFKS